MEGERENKKQVEYWKRLKYGRKNMEGERENKKQVEYWK